MTLRSSSWPAARTTARIAAFRPAQSPPPVSTPMRTGSSYASLRTSLVRTMTPNAQGQTSSSGDEHSGRFELVEPLVVIPEQPADDVTVIGTTGRDVTVGTDA